MIVVKVQGGLGNQMFQYALYKAFKEHGKDAKLDLSFYSYSKAHNGYELERIFDIKADYINISDLSKIYNINLKDYKNLFLNKLSNLVNNKIKQSYSNPDIFKEKDHTYVPDIFQFKKAYLDGYWQNELYFKDIKPIIQKAFMFKIKKDELSDKNKNILKVIQNSESVSVHIRRGDYVNHSSLGDICSDEYYYNALEYIKNKVGNVKIFVFSDDVDYCKENFSFANAEFIGWNKDKDSFFDMYLMSQCKHNIIANSTFSWWGAYLNQNFDKVVVMPKKWFSDKETGINQIDWIKI